MLLNHINVHCLHSYSLLASHVYLGGGIDPPTPKNVYLYLKSVYLLIYGHLIA